MNIHEQCLLNYLQKPDELSYTTDVLKINNYIFEKQMLKKIFLAKNTGVTYTD